VRAKLVTMIERCPAIDWLLAGWPNVWLGATIVNQEEADRDIPKLLATPARVRFLSMEPLLGPVYQLDRVGKKVAGRVLDGVTLDGFPEVT
jgi:protein gp37